VSSASVSVDGAVVGQIGRGLLVFLCVEKGDADQDAHHYANKVAGLRIFADDMGKMNLSVKDVSGAALVISQFTLAGDVEKGRRPSFERAAPPEDADRLYQAFARRLQDEGVHVATGVFRAMMQVALVNDGPVTILLGPRKGTEAAS
jgi:D-tyrosyl-tRNA(Tyr) deacylase